MHSAEYLSGEYRLDLEYGLIQEVCLNCNSTINPNLV